MLLQEQVADPGEHRQPEALRQQEAREEILEPARHRTFVVGHDPLSRRQSPTLARSARPSWAKPSIRSR